MATETGTATGLDRWLTDHAAELAQYRADPADDLDARIERSGALLGHLHAEGVYGAGWPEEFGGQGGTAVDRAQTYDALTTHGFGMPESVAGLEVLGNPLVRFAPEIARQALPGILSGADVWCQGFSEPEAGSDLASLRTTARRVDGGWSITGQKVWTSLAHRARWCGLLARTGDVESRHRGITFFWVPLPADGIEVRPLRTLSGEDDFCEVFFDGVFVPDEMVVGEPGQGWEIAMYALQFERGMWAWQRQAIMHTAMTELLHKTGADPADSDRIGRAYLKLAAVRAMSRSTVRHLASGTQLGPAVSADKVQLGMAEHAVHDLVRSMSPGFATSDAPTASLERREWFYARPATVYGGAVEIQKNIIARHILGLPAVRRG
jgi:alkylation response protein AidB-like acyl-CoA dehydrogenase